MQRATEEGACLLSNTQPCWRVCHAFLDRTFTGSLRYGCIEGRDLARWKEFGILVFTGGRNCCLALNQECLRVN